MKNASPLCPRLTLAGLALAVVPIAVSPAVARSRHHHIAAYGAGRDVRPAPRFYGGWEGEAVARATAQAYRDPGVTQELAPDAKQTATGGPSGGVPGFSGGM